MYRPVVLTLLLLLLSGCSMTGVETVTEIIATKGAAVHDKALNDAEWFLCYGASVGSVRRRYGSTEDGAATYRKLCAKGAGEVIEAPAK